jgi:hypothetical protein
VNCLFCGEEIEDGDIIVDGNHGKAVVREGEEEWRGEVEYSSQFSTVHKKCFDKAEENFKELKMSKYTLYCDEPHYVLVTYNGKMTQIDREVKSSDGLMSNDFYYWITSTDRDDVLVAEDFVAGEDAITGLDGGEFESFEDAVDKMKGRVELREERPRFQP